MFSLVLALPHKMDSFLLAWTRTIGDGQTRSIKCKFSSLRFHPHYTRIYCGGGGGGDDGAIVP